MLFVFPLFSRIALAFNTEWIALSSLFKYLFFLSSPKAIMNLLGLSFVNAPQPSPKYHPTRYANSSFSSNFVFISFV